MKPRQRELPPDGGYGWVVLASCIICQGIVASMQRISGLILVEVIEIYRVNRTQAFSLLVIFRCFGFLFAPVIGKLLTKFPYRNILCTGSFLLSLSLILTAFSTSYWQLIIVYGCLRGIANNCVMTASSLSAGLYFQKRRSFAMGLYYGSLGVAGFVAPMIFHWLQETYEFHGAILILGGISLHGCAFGMLVRQPSWVIHSRAEERVELLETELEEENVTNGKKEYRLLSESNHDNGFQKCANHKAKRTTPDALLLHGRLNYGISKVTSVFKDIWRDFRLFKDGYFLLQCSSRAFTNITGSYFLALLPDYVGYEFEHRISKQDVVYILSMSSIGEIVVRFGIGVVLDKLPWRKVHSMAATVTLMGMTVVTFQFLQNYTQLMFGVMFYGLWTGMNVVMQYLVEMENMGLQRIHMARGLSRFTIGFTTVLAGLLIGHLRDQLGSYKVCISLLGGSAITGGLVWTTEPLVFKCFPPQRKKTSSDASDDISSTQT